MRIRRAITAVLGGVALSLTLAPAAHATSEPEPSTITYRFVSGDAAALSLLKPTSVYRTYRFEDNTDFERDHPQLCTHKYVRKTHHRLTKWVCKHMPYAQAPEWTKTAVPGPGVT